MPEPWTIRLSPQATRQLAGLPRDQQVLIGRAIDRMQNDPFQGDVKPLQGRKWHGRYRKRVGRYRLIFIPQRQACVVEISAILLRDEQTYREHDQARALTLNDGNEVKRPRVSMGEQEDPDEPHSSTPRSP